MFQNIGKKVLIALVLITSLNAANKLEKDEVNKIEELELFKRAQIKVINAYDMGSLYLLNIKAQDKLDDIYLTKDKKYLIAGNVIDTSNGKSLTIPADLNTLKNKEALTYGTGKDRYYLFTDPECPYCKQFESHLPKVKDKVDIKVFFYPLDFHKNAKDLSMYVMSKKTNDEKIKAMINNDINNKDYINRKYTKKQEEELKKQLEVQMKIANYLKVRGTPAIFDKDGNSVVWVELLEKYGVNVR